MRSKFYLHKGIARELAIQRRGASEFDKEMATTPGDQMWNLEKIETLLNHVGPKSLESER